MTNHRHHTDPDTRDAVRLLRGLRDDLRRQQQSEAADSAPTGIVVNMPVTTSTTSDSMTVTTGEAGSGTWGDVATAGDPWGLTEWG